MLTDDRAASSVLAVILMMGFVAAGAVSLFVVGTATLNETKQTAQEEQVERTFKEFNKDVTSVAYGRDEHREMTFEIRDDGAAFRQQDTGHIEVVVDGTKVVDREVGSLVYERDGKTLAYQAGGIWEGTGEDSRMISDPPAEYTNGSFTFPIPSLQGEKTIRSGSLDIAKRETVAPLNDDGYVEGKLVTVKVTSEYYMGWAEYFRSEANGVAVSVDHSPAGPKGTVTVKLGKPVANGNFQDGVLATGGEDGDVEVDKNKKAPDSLAATGEIIGASGKENVDSDLFELDEAIQRKVSEARAVVDDPSDTSIETLDSDDPVTAGTYFVDGDLELDETLEVDLSSGNVTLVVDGDTDLTKNGIDVDTHGTDNKLYYYTTGDISQKGTHAGASKSEGAEHFQVYGTSDMLVGITGGSKTQFVGTVYAPREAAVLDDGEANPAAPKGSGSHCEGWDVCISAGSAGVTGAIVGGPTYMGQGTAVEYDDSLETLEPTLQLEDGVLPPPITYLRVAVHEVSVNNSDRKHLAPAGGVGASASVVAAGDALDSQSALASVGDDVRAGTADRRSPSPS